MKLRKFLPSWLFSSFGLIVVLFTALVLWVFFQGIDLSLISPKWKISSGVEVIHRAFSTSGGGEEASELDSEVKTADFTSFKSYLDIRESIQLTIVDTTIEFEVKALVEEKSPGARAFLVTPRKYQFRSTDIVKAVKTGLTPIPREDGMHPPKWSSWSIATNDADRVWTVRLEGVSGEGKIKLAVGEASDIVEVNLPRMLPIWRYVRFVDRRNGIVVIGGHDVKIGDTIAPDPARDLCGFRVHSISNRSVWFEVVYSKAAPAIERKLWPDLRIDYAELDNGESYSKVVFESGESMITGDQAQFDEKGDALKLDSGAFLPEAEGRAVRFRYLDRDNKLIADMVVVTFQP